jgi:hypothetical protein
LLTAEGVIFRSRAAGENPPSATARANTSISPERLISSLAIFDFNSQMPVVPTV